MTSILLDRQYEGHESFASLLQDVSNCLDETKNPPASEIPKKFAGFLHVIVQFYPVGSDLPPPEVIYEGTKITVKYPGWTRSAAWVHLNCNPPAGAVPAFGAGRTRTGCNGARRLWKRDHREDCPVWVYDPANPDASPPNWDPRDKQKHPRKPKKP